MENIQNYLGIVLGLIGIITALGGLAYWKGTVDSTVKDLNSIPGRTRGLETKMDILWELFVDQTLAGRPNLAKRGSGYKLTNEGEQCISGMNSAIERIKNQYPGASASDVLILITREIGMEELQKLAHMNQCTLPEVISLLTIAAGVVI